MRTYGTFEWKNNILYVVYPSFEPTLEEYKEYLYKLENHIISNESFFIIYDTTNSKYLSAENRTLQSNWINQNKNLLKEKVRGMIFIIPNLIVRVVLKTILAFSPLPCRHEVVNSTAEAEKFTV